MSRIVQRLGKALFFTHLPVRYAEAAVAEALMDFEWDDAKAESNERKHGVTFSEALTVFGDPLSVTGYDPRHADDEDRFLTMGVSVDGRLIVVSHTDRDDVVRIISAREATRRERKDYEDGNFP